MFLQFLKNSKKDLFFATIFMVITSFSTVMLAYLFKPAFDKVLINPKELSYIYIFAFALFTTFILKGVGQYGEKIYTSRIITKIINSLQANLFRHIIKADLSFFKENTTGELLTRLLGEPQLLRKSLTQILTSLSKDTMTLVFLLGYIFYQDFILAFSTLMLFPFAIFSVKKINAILMKMNEEAQSHNASLGGKIAELLRSVKIVKAFTHEKTDIEEFNKSSKILNDFFYRADKASALIYPLTEILAGVTICFIVTYNGYAIFKGHKTTGDFMTFISALVLAYEPIKRLSHLAGYKQEIKVFKKRYAEITHINPQIISSNYAPEKLLGKIEFQNVNFSYKKEIILSDANFTINSGERIAIIGESGSGKSTILDLVLRFFDVKTGKILIDGKEIKKYDLNYLRQKIALVSQECSLFNDTILNNLVYGLHSYSKEHVDNVCEHTHIKPFIDEVGYNMVVGEDGAKLSGGEKQRLTIARALLKDASIYLLDEPTSALDTHNEKMVNDTIDQLTKGKTTIIVTHQKRCLEFVDKIYVLKEGKLLNNKEC